MSSNEKITQSVGKMGMNRFADVSAVQNLLNGCIHLLVPLKLLACDGKVGLKTISAIEEFQRRVVKMTKPDGRVDPNGTTLRFLNQNYVPRNASTVTKAVSVSTSTPAPASTPVPLPVSKPVPVSAPTNTYQFPLKIKLSKSYKDGGRQFGANRANGRKHAGCDLLAPVGTAIYAMDDGEVISNIYAFYLGTYAIEVKHPNFVTRYGEISRVATDIKKGKNVKKGQVIAYVGKLQGLNYSMLHLELYSGKSQGGLTVRSNKPYQRRSDLMDPTKILDKATR